MQNIIITQDVVYGLMPQFLKGQKVRVADNIADDLVTRGHAKFDQGEKAVSSKAKEESESKKKK